MSDNQDPDKTVVRAVNAGALAMEADECTVVRTRILPVAPPQSQPAIGAGPRRLPPSATRRLTLPKDFRLHEYRIEGVLGQGGFGITYLATDTHLDAPVAIKEYLPEQIAFRTAGKTVMPNATRHRERYRHGLESFLVEARTLASLRHPNIVRVARFFEANKTAYMVLEYERGLPLKRWWPAQPPIPESDLLPLLQPLLDGLSVMHEAGILHRDIKPDNIQVRELDGSLVLLDFGSARHATLSGDEAEVAVTPGYAPMEQYMGSEQGPWTDIYALGATLYWMVTGKVPPPADLRLPGADSMVPAVQAAAGRFSPDFLAAIDWALNPDPRQRPQDLEAWSGLLFRAHAARLGLQHALRASEQQAAAGTARPRRWGHRVRAACGRVLRPAAWPLAAKMTMAIILTALAPMLITGAYNLSGSLQALSDSELRDLQQLARSTAGRLGQLISTSRHLARMVSVDGDFSAYLREPSAAANQELQHKLDDMVRANPDMDLVIVLDGQGNALISNDRAVVGRNFAFREYFKAAMAGRPHLTGIVVGSVAGAAGMFCAQPVFDAGQRVVGVVVLRIKASAFATVLEDIRRTSDRTAFAVDGDGVVILHPDASLLYASLGPLSPASAAAIKADQRFRRDHVADLGLPGLAQVMVGARDTGHVAFQAARSAEQEVAGYAPVPGHDWVVAVAESRDRFERPLRRLYLHLGLSAVLVGMLFTGLSLRFARSIVQPIRALTRAADALKDGDYARASVQVRRQDEIGQLARTFNVMIEVLRQRERQRDTAPGRANGGRA